MSHVVADLALVDSLRQAQQPLDLRDAAGKFLGRFIPASAVDDREPRISEEELNRREIAGGGRPLAAILADLEKRS